MSANPRLPIAAALVLALILGCKADTTGLEIVTLDELVALVEDQPDLVLCDANTLETREKYGVIPGAVLLTHYRDYAPAAELPADQSRKLVFYCHSAMCGAAADAARKAVASGYSDVAVYPDGIQGWSRAGRPIDPRAEG